MPQTSPMNWLMLSYYFIMLWLITLTSNYFIMKMIVKNKMNKNNNFIMKWY